MKQKYNCIVMGAAGRDFHIFLSFLRNNEHVPVVRVSYRFRQLDGPPLLPEVLQLMHRSD